MSISSRQNFWKPPPVPEMPTVMRVPLCSRWNSSATASVTGNTVLDPSTVMTAEDSTPASGAGAPPPHAVTAKVASTNPTGASERVGGIRGIMCPSTLPGQNVQRTSRMLHPR